MLNVGDRGIIKRFACSNVNTDGGGEVGFSLSVGDSEVVAVVSTGLETRDGPFSDSGIRLTNEFTEIVVDVEMSERSVTVVGRSGEVEGGRVDSSGG